MNFRRFSLGYYGENCISERLEIIDEGVRSSNEKEFQSDAGDVHSAELLRD